MRQTRYAVEAGVDFVQIREPDLSASDLSRLVNACVDLAAGSQTRIVVNDRVDVALACGAAGVHLRSDSVPSDAVRQLVPPGFVVGRSVHTEQEARAAAAHVDYVVAGTVWPTASKPTGHPILGVDGLRQIAASVRVPVLAIGGVTLERVPEVAAAGAAGFAAIGYFMDVAAGDGAVSACRAVPLAQLAEAARLRTV
jgi:thiamine-phosphate pyrophosphorylase